MPNVLEYQRQDQRPQRAARLHGLYLIECPFCGIAPSVETKCDAVTIECRAGDCKASASVTAPTEREAVSLWNHRR